VKDSDVSNLKIRLSNIRTTNTAEKNLKTAATEFISDYTSKESYEFILNIADFLDNCVYIEKEIGTPGEKETDGNTIKNLKSIAENIDKIHVRIINSEVPGVQKERVNAIKNSVNVTYLAEISAVEGKIETWTSGIAVAKKNKINKENSRETLGETKGKLSAEIELLKKEMDKKGKDNRTALLNTLKEEHRIVLQDYDDIKNASAKEGTTNLLIGIFLGIVAGILITYILKTESDYWSTYTSASMTNPVIKVALLITVILIIIFVVLNF